MGISDILLIILGVVGVAGLGIYFFNRWSAKKVGEQQVLVDKARQTVSIFVIDKKRARASEANLPKIVMDNLPKPYKLMKLGIVKAKVGSQITTLICDKNVYNTVPLKKNVKVDLAGIYLVEVKGAKAAEKNQNEKRRREAARQFDGSVEEPWYKTLFTGDNKR